MRTFVVVVAISVSSVVAALTATACKKLATGAREEFARKYSCPEERVEVKERPDVKWGQLTMPPSADEQPPAEVKNDPGRLAKWRADQSESGEAKLRAHYDAMDVFEVRGCDHALLMACKHPTSQGGTTMSSVMCSDRPLD
jgi:hypothetical protein